MQGRPEAIALDLDGTLLTSEKRITPRARRVIARLAAAGVHIVIATGRPPRSALPFVRELGVRSPTIVFHGAAIVDPGEARMRVLHTLDPAVVNAAVTRLRERVPDALLALETATGWYVDRRSAAAPGSGLRLDAAEPTAVGPIERHVAAGAIKLLARHPTLGAERMATAVAGLAVGVTWSDPHLLEVLHPAVDKRHALAAWCAGIGIDASRVAAFGDQHNDRGMLAWAGLGVAMANADPRALAVADLVTASNDEDGVAQVLEGWLPAAGVADG